VTHDLVEAASLADRILILSPSPARPIADIAVPDDLKRVGGDAAIRFAEQLRGLPPSMRRPRRLRPAAARSIADGRSDRYQQENRQGSFEGEDVDVAEMQEKTRPEPWSGRLLAVLWAAAALTAPGSCRGIAELAEFLRQLTGPGAIARSIKSTAPASSGWRRPGPFDRREGLSATRWWSTA